jgi:hypothetical protein
MVLVGLIVTFVFTIFSFLYVRKHLLSSLSNIPSIHWSVRWTNKWVLWQRYQKGNRRFSYEAHTSGREIREILLVAPNEISVMSKEYKKEITGFQKSQYHYTAFQNFGTPNLMSLTSKGYRERRQLLATIYSKSGSQSFIPIIEKQVHRFLECIARKVDCQNHSTSIQVHLNLRAMVIDILTRCVFGMDQGFTNMTEDGQNMQQFELWQEDIRSSSLYLEQWLQGSTLSQTIKCRHEKAESWFRNLDAEFGKLHDDQHCETIYAKLSTLRPSDRASELLDNIGE